MWNESIMRLQVDSYRILNFTSKHSFTTMFRHKRTKCCVKHGTLDIPFLNSDGQATSRKSWLQSNYCNTSKWFFFMSFCVNYVIYWFRYCFITDVTEEIKEIAFIWPLVFNITLCLTRKDKYCIFWCRL